MNCDTVTINWKLLCYKYTWLPISPPLRHYTSGGPVADSVLRRSSSGQYEQRVVVDRLLELVASGPCRRIPD